MLVTWRRVDLGFDRNAEGDQKVSNQLVDTHRPYEIGQLCGVQPRQRSLPGCNRHAVWSARISSTRLVQPLDDV
jgi:hypothetical protein